MRPLGMLIEHDGFVAQYRGERTDPSRPVTITRLALTYTPADRSPWRLGSAPQFNGGPSWSGTVETNGGGTVYLDMTGATEITVETPIAKPRDGARYTWEWRGDYGSAWEKCWYPLCPDCNRQHAEGKCKA